MPFMDMYEAVEFYRRTAKAKPSECVRLPAIMRVRFISRAEAKLVYS